jgi:hypothetical protein
MPGYCREKPRQDCPIGLGTSWWRTIEDAPIPPGPSEAGELKTTRLPVIMRETRLDGPLCDLAQSVAHNLTERHGTERMSEAFGCETAGIGCWH